MTDEQRRGGLPVGPLERRGFLKLTGGAVVAGSLMGCDPLLPFKQGVPVDYQRAKPDVPLSRNWEPGEEELVPSMCLQCPGGCGIQVRVCEGRAVKIDGNPLFPMNRGRLCLKGQSGLQTLYDPDRVPGPRRQLIRNGKRTGRWEKISWDEALDLVSGRLAELRTRAPEKLVFLGGRVRGSMDELIQRFMRAYGSPNTLNTGEDGYASVKMANYISHGVRDYLAYDLSKSRMVLCFGGLLLEAMRGTVHNIGGYVKMKVGHLGQRGKLVHIDPRFSVTGSKADQWVPITPGTDAALALGIAHVIIREEIYDKAFVEAHTHGFERYAKLVLGETYSPKEVARLTGVKAHVIEELAHEFARRRPSVALCGRGVGAQSNGTYAAFAINSLNALVGSINRPGGLLVQERPPIQQVLARDGLKLDAVAKAGVASPRLDGAGSPDFPFASSVVGKLAEGADKTPIEALFIYYMNPCFSQPNCKRFDTLLENVPFVVSFSPFWDDSTLQADLVLPDHTYLERHQDEFVTPGPGHAVYGFRQPVVAPIFDTRDSGDALLEVARRLGGSVAEAFPWKSMLDCIKAGAEGLGKWDELKLAERGGWWESADDEFELKDSGRRLAALKVERANTSDPQAARVVDAGIERTRRSMKALEKRIEAVRSKVYQGDWKQVFPNATGRFEFYSETLKQDLAKSAVQHGIDHEALLARMGIKARGDEVFLPHYEAPTAAGDAQRYPLLLNTFKTMAHAEGRGGNTPWLQNSLSVLIKKPRWEQWIEINPETAAEHGIKSHDLVRITSEVGSMTARARLYAGARPDVVNIPFEFGHRKPAGSNKPAYGRWATDRGENVNAIMGLTHDGLSGGPCWFGTRVRIEKVSEGGEA